MKYVFQKSSLSGSVTLSGAKNSALRLVVASILTDERLTITNAPTGILDMQIQLSMLERMGKKINIKGKTVFLSKRVTNPVLDWEGTSIRNVLLVLGCSLARFGFGEVPLPGGCNLGNRKVDLHFMVFEKLGAKVRKRNNRLYASIDGRLRGNEIIFPLRSTGATENAILCSVLADGKTVIWNPHVRPELLNLIALLRQMGAKIDVFGSQRIEVEGVEKLNGTRLSSIYDNVEGITWLIAAATTGSNITIRNFPSKDLQIPLIYLKEAGLKFKFNKNHLVVEPSDLYPIEIATGPHPSINSDLQPLFAIFAAFAKGKSVILDTRFKNRYAYIQELSKMGLKCSIKNGVLEIFGGNSLKGAEVVATDLRAGAALMLAGMNAKGITTVSNASQINRGYENLEEKIVGLGGNISIH